MIKKSIGLIPRYNWDYGIRDFIRASSAVIGFSNYQEDKLKKAFGQKPILTTSGRTSLYTILKSLDLPAGAGVGVPLFCCSVVFDAIKRADLIPIFLDIDLDDFNLSASDLKKKVSLLSAIIIVHMFGHPADIESIKHVAGKIPVIEDCAQSLFSKYRGEYTGFLASASFFSFRSGKYISAGEGSTIFCKDKILREKISKFVENLHRQNLRQELLHCATTYVKSTLYKRPWYGTIGYPIGRHLDKKLNLTAKSGFKPRGIAKSDLCIINERIENFALKIKHQRENALYLLNNIKLKNIFFPHERQGCLSNYYQFAIRFNNQKERDLMARYLWRNGIDSPKYLDEVIDVVKRRFGYGGDCPNAEKCSKTVLIIPNHYKLVRENIEFIAGCLNDSNK